MYIQGITENSETERIKDLHQAQFEDTDVGAMFEELFLAQLKYQDPLDPMDNNEFLSQMAEFNSLEQLKSLNTKLDALAGLNSDSIADGAALIGKLVSGVSSESMTSVYGIVDSLRIEEGTVYLNIGYDSLKLDEIYGVSNVVENTENTENEEA